MFEDRKIAQAAAQAEAQRLCASRGRNAEFQSLEFDSSEDTFANELFFICV